MHGQLTVKFINMLIQFMPVYVAIIMFIFEGTESTDVHLDQTQPRCKDSKLVMKF